VWVDYLGGNAYVRVSRGCSHAQTNTFGTHLQHVDHVCTIAMYSCKNKEYEANHHYILHPLHDLASSWELGNRACVDRELQVVPHKKNESNVVEITKNRDMLQI
jgi:hypothetical protein